MASQGVLAHTQQKLLGLPPVPQFLHHFLEEFEGDHDPSCEPRVLCAEFYQKHCDHEKKSRRRPINTISFGMTLKEWAPSSLQRKKVLGCSPMAPAFLSSGLGQPCTVGGRPWVYFLPTISEWRTHFAVAKLGSTVELVWPDLEGANHGNTEPPTPPLHGLGPTSFTPNAGAVPTNKRQRPHSSCSSPTGGMAVDVQSETESEGHGPMEIDFEWELQLEEEIQMEEQEMFESMLAL